MRPRVVAELRLEREELSCRPRFRIFRVALCLERFLDVGLAQHGIKALLFGRGVGETLEVVDEGSQQVHGFGGIGGRGDPPPPLLAAGTKLTPDSGA
jgi:hypothetical protein